MILKPAIQSPRRGTKAANRFNPKSEANYSSGVAQIFNLLYRRLAAGRRRAGLGGETFPRPAG